jgi:hypothetical protein
MTLKKKKILAIASAGGHWIQLMRLRPAFDGYEVIYASTNKSNRVYIGNNKFYYFKDADRQVFWNFFIMIPHIIFVLIKIRPSIIVTTGSAFGLMALIFGRLFSTKNVWIDSIANVEELSTSGKIARYFADLYLTQWEDLAKPEGPKYNGTIL